MKLADDGSGDVVARVYESCGGRAAATLTPGFEYRGVEVCDLLERPLGEEADPVRAALTVGDGAVSLRLRPFQLVTLRFARPAIGSLEAAA